MTTAEAKREIMKYRTITVITQQRLIVERLKAYQRLQAKAIEYVRQQILNEEQKLIREKVQHNLNIH